jgi:catechol 2,3-dioxygenase-like lactoylglutathione lyase family enzyme
MVAYLEHANITVPDIDAAIAFLQVVEPVFTVRHDATPEGSYRWAHVGTDHCYIALQEPHLHANPQHMQRPYKDYGVNHLAWVVDDLSAVVARLEASGYRRGIAVAPHPYRRRAYYYDAAGFEWEIVEYLSDKPEERHVYE